MFKELKQALEVLEADDIEGYLTQLCRLTEGQKIVFSSSLGLEDQLITHVIFRCELPIEVFTLDTGRLFAETEALIAATEAHYQRRILRFAPQPDAAKSYVEAHGMNGFYHSVENRKLCCHIRKVEPLNRALSGAAVWITGLRSEQSPFRQGVPLLEEDLERGLIKFNPLLAWTSQQVRAYIDAQGIPYNPLHDKGFPSIGCEPCTRAIKPGENERAGRWWWEQQDALHQECGLHLRE
ncbi:phosphoadenylyl-sulfate reductase [Thiomicrorhabdus sp.]|uniref:phosphoadenylyl-sulfate reductase n=1 Tax=Thiomicrorhabdus sp. TaxID=2039724 RepID=UPI0029C67EE3|nr:phosphoadenylyl-sulfate reductase [Thiomicrorhabdus sp.]